MEDDPTRQTILNWVAGKTKGGKDIRVKPNNMGHFYIEYALGTLPKALSGLYTSIPDAQNAVNAYLVSTNYVYKRDSINKAVEENDAKRASRSSKRKLQQGSDN